MFGYLVLFLIIWFIVSYIKFGMILIGRLDDGFQSINNIVLILCDIFISMPYVMTVFVIGHIASLFKKSIN